MAISQSNLTLLLQKLQDLSVKSNPSLENSRDTWSKIGSGESFSDLGFDSEEDLKEWIANNPYANI